ncbi:hypothetical protein EGW35_01885 [Enterococcus durans]|nr:hypothetical protein EGW35_01885 [Enterococcus durans]
MLFLAKFVNHSSSKHSFSRTIFLKNRSFVKIIVIIPVFNLKKNSFFNLFDVPINTLYNIVNDQTLERS